MAHDHNNDEEYERRRRTILEARATVERLKDVEAEPPPLFVEATNARWAREIDEAAAARIAHKAAIATAKVPDMSDVDARIANAVAAEHERMIAIVGAAIAELMNSERREIMAKLRDETRELKIEVAKFASEVAELRAATAVERARVLDLPALPRRVN
jgi:hypothetical protein